MKQLLYKQRPISLQVLLLLLEVAAASCTALCCRVAAAVSNTSCLCMR
jgi:hypothetical protein